jgi:molybdopterin converting factor subunit 1
MARSGTGASFLSTTNRWAAKLGAMSTVTIRLFARLAEMVGSREVEVEIGEGLTAVDAFRLLARSHPEMAPLERKVMYAINQEYVEAESPLRDGDELAVIPPVSGGARVF